MIFDSVLMRIIWTINKPLLFMDNNFDKTAFSRGKTMASVSSQTCKNKFLPVFLQSNVKAEWKTSIKNWPCGKLSSSLVFDIIKISIEPWICSHRRSNLFLKELIFRCPNINLLILLIRMFLGVFLASETVAIQALDIFSFSLQVSLNGIKNQFPSINLISFWERHYYPSYLNAVSWCQDVLLLGYP